MKRKRRIAVAMSGGVDSSVAAALLQQQGYDVIGIFAKTWTPLPGDGTECTWVAERRDALSVAAHLNIPLHTIDAEEEFRAQVVRPWIEGYRRGETPNPDVWCNRVVKFGTLFRAARAFGATEMATGHYARIEGAANPRLLRGNDPLKDQSYFLWDVPADVLSSIRFPIGQLSKKRVRILARQFNLPVAAKKDSQGICMLGSLETRLFLQKNIASRPGPVYAALTGRLIGQHDGLVGLTVGQRHGWGKVDPQSHEPSYITRIDSAENAFWVGPLAALERTSVVTRGENWLDPAASSRLLAGERLAVEAQIRYRQTPKSAIIQAGASGCTEVKFNVPVLAPAPGQSIVFYDRDQLIGGAVIASTSIDGQ